MIASTKGGYVLPGLNLPVCLLATSR